jgi:hypothetical protein
MQKIVLANDLLFGVPAIAAYVYGSSDQKSQRKIYHAAACGYLPITKKGSKWVARRSELERAFSSSAT